MPESSKLAIVIGRQVRYGQPMTDDETFEFIRIGPDGLVVRGQHPLIKGVVPNEMETHIKEGPSSWISRYVRTDHKIEGRVRFDWFDTEGIDTGKIYRLASVDGLGRHDLVNDPE